MGSGVTFDGYTRAAQQVHSLFIDIHELTDRTELGLFVLGIME